MKFYSVYSALIYNCCCDAPWCWLASTLIGLGWYEASESCLKGQCHLRIISNFFENSRRYSQFKVHHRCQRHRWQICHRCQWHCWQIAVGINNTSGKFCHQFPLCCWHRCQIIGTKSGCRHLKVNLKAKIYVYVSSTSQRWPNKIIKIFLIEDFLVLRQNVGSHNVYVT